MNYYYNDYGMGAGFGFAAVCSVIILVLVILAIVAYFLTIGCLVHSAKTKGHHTNGAGKLWFIGIFGTPILLALYVISLPDRGGVPADPQAGYPQYPQELN